MKDENLGLLFTLCLFFSGLGMTSYHIGAMTDPGFGWITLGTTLVVFASAVMYRWK